MGSRKMDDGKVLQLVDARTGQTQRVKIGDVFVPIDHDEKFVVEGFMCGYIFLKSLEKGTIIETELKLFSRGWVSTD